MDIERSPEFEDELLGWWDGVIGGGDQLLCAPGEVALVLDGDAVLATLGPGRHTLTPESQPALEDYLDETALDVAFVAQRSTIDFEGPMGSFEDPQKKRYEPSVSGSFAVVVKDPALVVGLRDELEEDQLVEDFLIDEVVDAASEALSAIDPPLATLAKGGELPGWLEGTQRLVNEVVGELGMSLEVLGPLVVQLDDAALAAAGVQLDADGLRPLPPRPKRGCPECGAEVAPGTTVCPSCGAAL